MKAKLGRLPLILFAVVVLLVLFKLFNRPPKLRFLGPSPAYLKIITVEEVEAKPVIDIALPTGHRLIYPTPYTGPFSPLYSGDRINSKIYSGAIYDSRHVGSATPPFSGGSVFISSARWTIDGRVYETRQWSSWGDPIYCPLLFGTEAKKVLLETDAFENPTKLEVLLPASGKPAPPLPVFRKNLSGWQVDLQPNRWISPGFSVSYRLKVDDGRGSAFWISQGGDDFNEPIAWNTLVRPGQDGSLKPLNSIGTDVIPTKSRSSVLSIARLAPVRKRVKVLRNARGDISLVDRANEAAIRLVATSGNIDGLNAEYIPAAEIGGHWLLTAAYDEDTQHATRKFLRGLPEAEEVDVVLYRIAEIKKMQWDFKMPSIR